MFRITYGVNIFFFFLLLTAQCRGIAKFTANAPNCTKPQDVVDFLQLANSSHYDGRALPVPLRAKDKLPIVKVGVRVQAISGINDTSQKFALDALVDVCWFDLRLNYTSVKPCQKGISIPHAMSNYLWSPNICFINTKDAVIHESPFKNLYAMIFHFGMVWIGFRTTLIGPCEASLHAFPMDTQSCYIRFESFTYNRDQIRVKWIRQRPVRLSPHLIVLGDFYITNVSAFSNVKNHSAGEWDEMVMKFTFARRYGWYLFNVYLPTYFVVFVSWISFFLGVKAVPARTMIGVNALVALTVQFGGIIQDLPRVSYIKAIGMLFVFASIIELAIVACMSRRESKQPTTPAEDRCDGYKSPKMQHLGRWRRMSCEPPDCPNVQHRRHRNVRYRRQRSHSPGDRSPTCSPIRNMTIAPERLDKVSAVMFPVMFALFNAYYWIYYMVVFQ